MTTDNDGREISVRTIYGTSLKGLDKGCLVLNIERENGYVVGTIDNINNGSDAQYWTDSFLHVSARDDDYHQTVKLMDMCTGFVQQLKEQSEVDSVIAAKKTAELLKTSETVQVDELADLLCQNEEQKQAFDTYRQSFEEEYGSFADEISVVSKAASRKPVSRMNVLKLGNDFEVKVLNPDADIESGVDELSGKRFYTLYY